jgi:ribonuclease HI
MNKGVVEWNQKLRWYVDGAGWNGSKSRYVIANEREVFPIVEFPTPFTNNEMEYEAMIRALEEAGEGDEIYCDSQLIVNQMSGRYKVKAANLRPYWSETKELRDKKNIKITWIRREENKAGMILERT